MIGLFIVLLFSFIFIISYYKSVNLFIKFTIIFALSFRFILAKLSFPFTNLSYVFIFLLILFLLIINFNSIINNKHSKVILGSQIVFIIYILLSSFIRGDFINMFNMTKFYFFGSYLFLVITSSKTKIDFNKLDRFILIITILLACVGLFQYLVPSSYDFFYVDLSKLGYIVSDADIDKRVIGLSFSPVNYSNLLSFLLIYTFTFVINKNNLVLKKHIKVAGMLIGILTILLAGISTPLVSLILGVFIISIFNGNKKLLFISIVFSLALFVNWDLIVSIGSSYEHTQGFSNPIARTLKMFSVIDGGNVTTESTFSLTVLALQDFLVNPIIGSRDEMRWLQAFSITDAYLLYHFVQYGIIGMFLIFTPYFHVIIKNKILQVLFIVLLVQTLNDNGLFYTPSNLIFWIISAINIKKHHNDVIIYER